MQQVPLFHHGGFHETPCSCHSDYEAHFRVKPRVKRSFSFEELQSGSCFQFFDEYDLQFYRVYGQPVFIPAEDSQDGLVSHDHPYPLSLLHYPYQQQQSTFSSSVPPPLHHKSYALEGWLGDCTSHTATHSASHSESPIPAHSYDHGAQHPGTQSSIPVAYSSGLASDHLPGGTAPAFESLSMAQYPGVNASYGDDNNSTSVADGSDSLMNHLYTSSVELPSIQCASPIQEEPGQSTPFGHGAPALISQQPSQPQSAPSASVSNGWADPTPHMTVPSQAYPPDQVRDTSKGDHVASAPTPRHQSQSPSPRTQQQAQPSQINPHQPHGKGRSLDKKPALACLFCRGRKIACGPPLPGSKDKTCNQCARRHLKCEYPLESRRGMRKRRSIVPRAGSATPAVQSPPSATGSGSNGIKREKSPERPTATKMLFKGRKRSS